MRLELILDTDNDAFRHPHEVSRILRGVSRRLDGLVLTEDDLFPLRDMNGNMVGKVKITGEEDVDHE